MPLKKTGFLGISAQIQYLSQKVLTDSKKVYEKGLDYAPIQSKINEPNYELVFKSFAEGCALSGIFVMRLPLNSVRHLHLHPNLCGNHLKVILLLKYF